MELTLASAIYEVKCVVDFAPSPTQPFPSCQDYIAKCAKKTVGPSNQTRWKSVGINHHIMQVLSEIASLGGSP